MLIDVDLGDAQTWELIRELDNRYLDEQEISSLMDIVKQSDSEKIKLFVSVMNRFSILELSEMFNEEIPGVSESENQLSIPFHQPCLHDGKINSGHHADQPCWCDKCGEEL